MPVRSRNLKIIRSFFLEKCLGRLFFFMENGTGTFYVPLSVCTRDEITYVELLYCVRKYLGAHYFITGSYTMRYRHQLFFQLFFNISKKKSLTMALSSSCTDKNKA